MRRGLQWTVGVLAVTAMVAAGSGPATADGRSSDVLQQAVDGWASDTGAPGMTAQIVDTSGVVAQASAGLDGSGNPVDVHTPFVWGSVSKQLAAAIVLGLAREGIVDEATPVIDVVPEAQHMLADPAVTVDDLIHHTSGLPHDITVTDDWSRRSSASEVVASLTEPAGTNDRGEFRYSSLNYLLLQAVVEQSTGGPLADALERQVLQPAKASSTITDADAFTQDVPPGHVPFFGTARPIDVGVDSAGLGYGYLAGSIDDLGRYASWRLAQLQNGEESSPEVDTGQGTQYGHGLFHENIERQDVWWHSGAVPGYYTYVALVPEQNTAIVLASNRYGELEADRSAAVGRNLTMLVLDGSANELPRSLALPVLGVLLGLTAVVLGVLAWFAIRLFTGRTRERTGAGAWVRIVVAVLVASVILVGGYVGIPALIGATPSVMKLWAPDATLAFAAFLVAVFLTAVLIVTNEVVGYTRHRRR